MVPCGRERPGQTQGVHITLRQVNRLGRERSNETTGVSPQKGGKVSNSDQVNMDRELRVSMWSVNERQSNVEEYKYLVSELLIGQKMFIPNRNIR